MLVILMMVKNAELLVDWYMVTHINHTIGAGQLMSQQYRMGAPQLLQVNLYIVAKFLQNP